MKQSGWRSDVSERKHVACRETACGFNSKSSVIIQGYRAKMCWKIREGMEVETGKVPILSSVEE